MYIVPFTKKLLLLMVFLKKLSILNLVVALAQLCFATGAFGQTAAIYGLHPRPKVAFVRTGLTDFQITKVVPIFIPDVPQPLTVKAIGFLQSILKNRIGDTLRLRLQSSYSGERPAIFIGEPVASPSLAAALAKVIPMGENLPTAGGYILDVESDLLLLAGSDPEGTFNSVSTLSQLILGSTGKIEASHIWDYPDFPRRWIYSSHNLLVPTQVKALETIEDSMVMHKMNGVSQNDFKYTILDRMQSNYFANVDSLKTYSQNRNIEIVPGVMPIGYSEGLLIHDPNLAEGVPAFAKYVIESDTGRLLPEPGMTLPNGDFESVTNNQFTGWSFYDGPNQSVFVDHATVHSGATSARCTTFSAGNVNGNCRFNRSLNCKPYHYYVMTCYAKTDQLNPTSVQLLAIGYDDNNNSRTLTSTQYSIPTTSNGWIKMQVAFNTLNFPHVYVYTGLWGGNKGTIWYDDFQIREAGLLNVVRRGGAPLWIRNHKTGAAFKEGVDFSPVVDNVFAQANGNFGLDHNPAALHRLSTGAIKNGDTVDVSFFHALTTISDTSGYGQATVCLSEDTLFTLLKDEIDRVDQLHHPKKFFMQHDEIRVIGWDSACVSKKESAAALLAENTTRCSQIIQQKHPGAEVIAWNDMFDSLHNAVNNYYLTNGDLSGIWNLIPKAITIMNWNYRYIDTSMRPLAALGFSQMTAPYYDVHDTYTIRNWRKAMEGIANVKGMMYTTWAADYSYLTAFADYAWGLAPYIIHKPIDSSALVGLHSGDSIRVRVQVLADSYDASDVITSVYLKVYTGVIDSIPMRADTGTGWIGSIHQSQNFSYSVTARNKQGLSHTTPQYIVALTPSGVANALARSEDAMKVYPNPANETTTLGLTLSKGGLWHVKIFDILGREVLSEAKFTGAGQQRVTLDLSALPVGSYKCEAITAGGTFTHAINILR
jgi:hypothetical protein